MPSDKTVDPAKSGDDDTVIAEGMSSLYTLFLAYHTFATGWLTFDSLRLVPQPLRKLLLLRRTDSVLRVPHQPVRVYLLGSRLRDSVAGLSLNVCWMFELHSLYRMIRECSPGSQI